MSSNIPTNKDEAEAWVREFHRVCDLLDTSVLDSIFTQDIAQQFGNYPEIHGLEGVKSLLGPQFALLEEMHHKLRYADVVDNRVYQVGTISYVVKGDTKDNTIEFPAAAVHHIATEGPEKGKTKRFEVFLNNTELVDRMTQVAQAEK